ncbi:MAG: beta-ketoacyl synthase chain length factor [Desulfovibrio sp.]|jgi:3-oxoacyl-[acyl-carrier-protein] synthase II|nr:beta-ketoacyl synthase chain length factor [Desulfovibrio sp.]
MTLFVEGFACLGSFGTGAQCLADAVRAGRTESFTQLADISRLSDFFPARALRQCDRFSRLALLGACLAAEDAGLSHTGTDNCGVVLATGYGSAVPTFDFLDSILEHGEQMASPLAFSLSVHNIPAAIVSKTLRVQGPCATVCQFESAAASGLMLASQWLYGGRVDRVIFGAVDEYTELLASVTRRLARLREAEGTGEGRRSLPLGEGAAFFILSREEKKSVGRITAVSLQSGPSCREKTAPDDCPCFLSGATSFEARNRPGVFDGSKVYGNIPVAAALDCAAALVMLQKEDAAFSRCRCRNYGPYVCSEIVIEKTRP